MFYKLAKKLFIQTIDKIRQPCKSPASWLLKSPETMASGKAHLHSVFSELNLSSREATSYHHDNLNSTRVPRLVFLTQLTAEGSHYAIYALWAACNHYKFHLYLIICKRHIMKALNREHSKYLKQIRLQHILFGKKGFKYKN